MAKKVTGYVKLQIEAGKATPAPPVGTALGPQGVNIMDFCKAFNAKTAKDAGLIIPVVVTVYSDRSYSFITKTPPAAVLLKKAAKLEKGSGVPNKTKVGVQQAHLPPPPPPPPAPVEHNITLPAGTAVPVRI